MVGDMATGIVEWSFEPGRYPQTRLRNASAFGPGGFDL
jgi:hypothetical protein